MKKKGKIGTVDYAAKSIDVKRFALRPNQLHAEFVDYAAKSIDVKRVRQLQPKCGFVVDYAAKSFDVKRL